MVKGDHDTAKQYLAKAVAQMQDEVGKHPHREHILDLRYHLGSDSEFIVEFLRSLHAPRSKAEMFTARFRAGIERYRASAPGTLGCPVAVLVNRRSGDTAGIVVAAMRKMCHSTLVIGEKTVGRGILFQTLYGRGLAVSFPVRELFSRNGKHLRRIEGRVVRPDIRVRDRMKLLGPLSKPGGAALLPPGTDLWKYVKDPILDVALRLSKKRLKRVGG